ncbi:trypsin-3 isoform X2 [Hydra vulgaris]|uniref:Trypsin-3 isoform X2 n=1 Tax=Hydra vulgaris TaxID=6087 RepID=A0ABM4C7Q4_HYDVU
MIKILFFFLLMVALITTASACSDYSQQWCQANQVLCTQPSLIAFMSQYCEQTCNYCSLPGVLPVGCGKPSIQSSRVIAGTTPTKGSWPWQVLLWQGGKAFCGGTLIHREWVLTAAHCVHGKEFDASQIYTRTGEHTLSVNEGTEEDIPALKIIKHRGYNPQTLDNDIALIKLSRPCRLSSYVSTACLPTIEAAPGTTCFISGWGKISHPGSMTNVLQQAKMNVVDHQTCENLNRRTIPVSITKGMLCAGDGGATQISGCHGDSGGPLVCNTGGKWQVYGAVSHGSGDCRSDKTYTVFANVVYFRSWIDNAMLQ